MENNSNVLNPYSAQSYSKTLFINVYRILFGILAILGNGLILYTIARHPSVRRNLFNLLIGVLAFADFWTGICYCYSGKMIVITVFTCTNYSKCQIKLGRE